MMKIIVQDNDEDIREVIKLTSEEIDSIAYTINTAANLLAEIKEFNPDVVLLDFKLMEHNV